MHKIKFFVDLITQIGLWLNQMSKKGYRLVGVNKMIYSFEKHSQRFSYTTQFIGGASPKENQAYMHMLEEVGLHYYRAPVNQGNLSLGKIRIRPFVKGYGKFANTWQDYHREILIVEETGEEVKPLLTNWKDLALQYKSIRNAYIQGFLLLTLLFVYGWLEIVQIGFLWKPIFLSFLLFLFSCYIGMLLILAHKNYKKYKDLSILEEA